MRGSSEARADLASDHLELRCYGLRADDDGVYGRLLQDRLGVSLQVVGGCLVSQELIDETKAYNRIMTDEIERRFGKGILDDLAEEAQQMYEAQRKQQQGKTGS